MTTNAKNSNESKNSNNNIPKWQAITGLTAERENSMSADERDEGIRKLLREVDGLARAEFARGERVPGGERTVFWEPLERVCKRLEISRVKLSALSRELTGMRAHELTDRIKAEKLETLMTDRVMRVLTPEMEVLRRNVDLKRAGPVEYRRSCAMYLLRYAKKERSEESRARFAAELGFANPSRLSRACLLAHNMSIDEMEGRIVFRIVQKFFRELLEGLKQENPPASGAEIAVKIAETLKGAVALNDTKHAPGQSTLKENAILAGA